MKDTNRILVVDDDPRLLDAVTLYLSKRQWDVVAASNGHEALEKFLQNPIDLVVLDIMMPGMDGWELCTRLRAITDVPMIMLTARGQEYDRTKGLQIGADDYLVKPFSLRELETRVAAMMRLSQHMPAEDVQIYYDDGMLLIDGRQRQVLKRGTRVELTATERRLFFLLAANSDHVLPSPRILETVWGSAYLEQGDLVEILIRRLRQKIEPNPSEPIYLIEEQGVGYGLARQPGAINSPPLAKQG